MSRVKSGAAAASASAVAAASYAVGVVPDDTSSAAGASAATKLQAAVDTFRTEHEVTAAQASQQAASAEHGAARPPWEALTDEELPYAAEIKAACSELAKSSLTSKERLEELFFETRTANFH